MTASLRVIGADPGLSGALALYVPATGSLQIEDMPVSQVRKGKTTKRLVDHVALARLFDFWCGNGAQTVAFVEVVASRPGEGVASAFGFGRSYGALKQAAHGQFIRVEDVTPPVWKRGVGLPVGATKDQSRLLAANVFPRFAALFARAKDDGRAEAALIARWGALKIAQEKL